MDTVSGPAQQRQTVLVVGNSPSGVPAMQAHLGDGFGLTWVADWPQLLPFVLATPAPAAILLEMGGTSDVALCQRLCSDALTRPIPVLCVGVPREDVVALVMDLGVADWISPDTAPSLTRQRLANAIWARRAHAGLAAHSELVEQEITARVQQTAAIQDVTLLAMASLAETRDTDTGNHLRRVQHYVRALARKLSSHPRFSAALSPRNIGMIFKSAPLHDVGKVCLPDRVLLKPGKLSEEEFEIMKTHTTLGRDAIAHAEETLGVDVDFFAYAKEIAYSHHEKWDGTGYPLGLAGEQIPVSARLMAVADVYDALISRRVYKPTMPHAEAVRIIAQTRGRHFDPDMVDAFLDLQDTFEAIAIAFSDTDADLDKKAAYLLKAQI
ncbi:HD domain-containing phosphohydrolase [uncultured Rhodoferax sp.]|uniref:HD domain-containing protein n=1 Tax=uncultured Rhodoferax sp. TaxID=223188 RepID=UPI0025CCA8E3|nr:HD domain-containing phosphohydrolase [uncultured Rhodoferax sp.]